MGIVKALVMGDGKVGRSTLIHVLARADVQPLKTWEPRQDSACVTVVVHKEDRSQTYVEEIGGMPFPAKSLSACDAVVLCFSLVDRRTWASIKNYYLKHVLAEVEKNQGYRPVFLVGTKSDVRDLLVKEAADQKRGQRKGPTPSAASPSLQTPERLQRPCPEDARCSVLSLPLNALFRVFDCLSTAELIAASLVCADWASAARHPYNWQSRAKGLVATAEVRAYLGTPDLAPFPIFYHEVNLLTADSKTGAQMVRPRPVQEFLYSLVNTTATFSRTLPPLVAAYFDAKRAHADANASETPPPPTESTATPSSSIENTPTVPN